MRPYQVWPVTLSRPLQNNDPDCDSSFRGPRCRASYTVSSIGSSLMKNNMAPPISTDTSCEIQMTEWLQMGCPSIRWTDLPTLCKSICFKKSHTDTSTEPAVELEAAKRGHIRLGCLGRLWSLWSWLKIRATPLKCRTVTWGPTRETKQVWIQMIQIDGHI